jgi:hypothetical protein
MKIKTTELKRQIQEAVEQALTEGPFTPDQGTIDNIIMIAVNNGQWYGAYKGGAMSSTEIAKKATMEYLKELAKSNREEMFDKFFQSALERQIEAYWRDK